MSEPAKSIRRITVDDVRAACQSTGYRLEADVTLDANAKYGCPIGVVCLAETGSPVWYVSVASRAIGLDRRYSTAFVAGFDDDPGSAVQYLMVGEPASLGYEDGRRIRRELLPATCGPTIEFVGDETDLD